MVIFWNSTESVCIYFHFTQNSRNNTNFSNDMRMSKWWHVHFASCVKQSILGETVHFNWMEHFFLSNLCWIKYRANHNAFRDCRYMQCCQNGQNKALSSLLHCQWCFQGRKLNRIWKRAAALASSSWTWHCAFNPFIIISRCMQMLDTNNKPYFKAQPIHNASSWGRNKENVQFAWENSCFLTRTQQPHLKTIAHS